MSIIITDRMQLRDKVRGAYSAAAEHPEVTHSFPVGWQFAESRGYPAELLASFAECGVRCFCGRVQRLAGCGSSGRGNRSGLGLWVWDGRALPHGGWGQLEGSSAWTLAPQCCLALAKPSPNPVSLM
jgi:hypothetical protein